MDPKSTDQAAENTANAAAPADQTSAEQQPATTEQPADTQTAADISNQPEQQPAEAGETTNANPNAAVPADQSSSSLIDPPPPITPMPTNPAAPPSAAAPAGPPPNKFKALLQNKRVLMIIAALVVLLLIGGGVYFFMNRGKKPDAAGGNNANQNNEASESATTADLPTCVPGYTPYINGHFFICYPSHLTPSEDTAAAAENKQPLDTYIFEDDAEILTITSNFKGNLSKDDCATSKVVKIGELSAQRVQLKDRTKTNGCAQAIKSYTTLVSTGNDAPVYSINLTKKVGNYPADSSVFQTIEQSFLLNGATQEAE